jgi:serine/threonine protein kinase
MIGPHMIGQHLREGDVLARRYRLGERIGAGGMSVIWRAWDEALERTVAVKVLDGPLGTDHADRELIRREARAAARIEHPNAIQVYDYGETVTPRGRIAAYVVMQLLDGASLADRLAAGPLDWPEAVAVSATVADVLAAAHRRGVVHRDVTPENVMLTTDGVKLLDFGIAAEYGQREDTLTFGTPPYVAPERLAGGQATGATDVYALGVLLFESLAGALPFDATTWDDLESVPRRAAELDVPGLPPAIVAICRRCLATDPSERPTAEELALALSATSSPRRRWWIPVAALAAALAVVLTVLVWDNGRTSQNASSGGPVTSTTPAPAGPGGSAAVSVPGTPGASVTAARPTRSPSAAPSAAVPSPSLPTVEQATNAVNAILDRRQAAGEIRSDVVLDIRNQVGNLVANPSDIQSKVDNLRRNLRERQRQQAMSVDAFNELDAAIVTLGAALAQP